MTQDHHTSMPGTQKQEPDPTTNEPVHRPCARPTIHWTELPDERPDTPLATEWNFYRRVVGGLLAEGQEGKWLLVKNEEIIGIWDTEAEANEVRLQRFRMQPVLMKQVLANEPIFRIGYNRLLTVEGPAGSCTIDYYLERNQRKGTWCWPCP